jgi:hypothetical protein
LLFWCGFRYGGFVMGVVTKLTALRVLLPQVGILRERGMARSIFERAAIDGEGHPLPWMSYPFIDYIEGLDLSKLSLFEFGSGNSTRYWAARCARVSAVEHDRAWYEQLKPVLPQTATVTFAGDEDAYMAAVGHGGPYDIIVVDGGFNRRRMAEAAIPQVSASGMIVLDNSDVHVRVAEVLRQADLIQVDFCGFTPGVHYETYTSIFFKPGFRPVPRQRWIPRKSAGCMQHIYEQE